VLLKAMQEGHVHATEHDNAGLSQLENRAIASRKALSEDAVGLRQDCTDTSGTWTAHDDLNSACEDRSRLISSRRRHDLPGAHSAPTDWVWQQHTRQRSNLNMLSPKRCGPHSDSGCSKTARGRTAKSILLLSKSSSKKVCRFLFVMLHFCPCESLCVFCMYLHAHPYAVSPCPCWHHLAALTGTLTGYFPRIGANYVYFNLAISQSPRKGTDEQAESSLKSLELSRQWPSLAYYCDIYIYVVALSCCRSSSTNHHKRESHEFSRHRRRGVCALSSPWHRIRQHNSAHFSFNWHI
jgi:hypothetical protein